MGANTSQMEKDLNGDQQLANEHFYGLVNFGNTCYCNSVIQALYFCRPFRDKVLAYKAAIKKNSKHTKDKEVKENLLTCLADLFHNIASQKRRVGSIAPKKFVAKLKHENELFDNFMQQDAHEFLNYLLNTIGDILVEDRKNATVANPSRSSAPTILNGTANTPLTINTNMGRSTSGSINAVAPSPASTAVSPDGVSLHSAPADRQPPSATSSISRPVSKEGCNNATPTTPTPFKVSDPTWVHDIFQGTLTNETRCLNCESMSSKDEDFLDLSVDVEPNASITHCLRVFSTVETLANEHKYYCENCCSKQEAQKRMRVKRLPQVLAIQLKRFKYQEHLNRFAKLSNRVLFSLELRLFNIAEGCANADRMYDLVAVVIHCGSTPNRGHYITVVKSHGHWLLFDDDMVDRIEATSIEDFFGLSDANMPKNSESAYILFYQARDC